MLQSQTVQLQTSSRILMFGSIALVVCQDRQTDRQTVIEEVAWYEGIGNCLRACADKSSMRGTCTSDIIVRRTTVFEKNFSYSENCPPI